MKRIWLCIVLTICISSILNSQPITPSHVILIGIDGMLGEGLRASKTPAIDSLAKAGCISWKTRSVMPSVSAPNWSAILSGAGPEQTGVTNNAWTFGKHSLEPTERDQTGYFPTVFSVLKIQMPEAKTCMFYDWDWLGQYINNSLVTKMELLTGYQNVTNSALAYITAEKPLFSFIYYGHPDEVGHEKGFMTEEYKQSLNDIDKEVGKIVKAVKKAGMFEKTVFIIVTDHGGVDKSHGGETPAEMEIPWIIEGPGMRKGKVLTKPNDNMNTAMTIILMLNLTPPESWVARPVFEAFDLQGPE